MVQNGEMCIWCLVDPESELEERWFKLVVTGHPIDDSVNLRFIGTIQLAGGELIYHLFERRDE